MHARGMEVWGGWDALGELRLVLQLEAAGAEVECAGHARDGSGATG